MRQRQRRQLQHRALQRWGCGFRGEDVVGCVCSLGPCLRVQHAKDVLQAS